MSLRLKRRGKGNWYIRGVVAGPLRTIRVNETTGTRDPGEAEAILAVRQTQLFEEAVWGPRAVVSFRACALSYLEWEPRSARTVIDVNRLAEHFGAQRLSAIDQDAVDAAVKALLGPDAAPATKVRTVYGPLTAVLTHGSARKWCDRPKFERPEIPKSKTAWLTPAQALELVAAAADHLKPLLLFILCTGARLSEALYLDWADVDLPAALAHFRDTKSGADRAAALTPAAVILLANLPGGNEREGAVFRRDDGEPYSEKHDGSGGQIKKAWGTACRRAGLSGVTPHSLRHSWASWLYAVTKDPMLVKQEGGWKSLAMVERYAHLMPSALIPEIARVWGASHPRVGALPGAAQAGEARTA